jgi:purine-cytosine permease-like protein
VTRDPDDEALSWGDETDPTHVDAPVEERAAVDASDAPTTSSAMLVIYGIFAGAYLLYIVGWIIAVQRDTYTQASLLAEIMYQFGEFLAIASPAIWLGAVLVLTRGGRALTRVLWLLAGMLLLAPWPFILGAFV